MNRKKIDYHTLETENFCNTNNHHEYDPYICDTENILIDKDWWNQLSPIAKELISKKSIEFGVKLDCKTTVLVPHDICKNINTLCVYLSYIDSHDYQNWYPSVAQYMTQEVATLHLSKSDKSLLLRIAEKRLKGVEKFHEDDVEDLQPLRTRIESVFRSIQTPVFVRLSSTSGKNESSLRPLYDAQDVIDRLTSVKLFLPIEYQREKETFVVLMPWRYDIEKRNEFRVFYCDGKVTGVSQQYWYERFNYSQQELEETERAIISAAFFQPNVAPYNRFVADVWIKDSKCNLIEMNPFGAHCGTGSALFHWINDFDLLYGKTNEKPELKYVE